MDDGRFDGPILARLLARVEQDGNVTQRQLARELGVALGLVNAYLKRCASKGLLKVREVPSRRYAYYLTPWGFAEKARLTADYLTWSLTYFRQAKGDCASVLAEAKARGWRSVSFVGVSEIAEIALICAIEGDLPVLSIVDGACVRPHLMSVPIVKFDTAPDCDGWIVTAITGAQAIYDDVVRHKGAEVVLSVPLLNVAQAAHDRPAPLDDRSLWRADPAATSTRSDTWI